MAVVVALSVTLLCVVASFVLDFGLIRVDRQVHKSAADSAVRAGIHGLDLGDSTPHPYAGVCAAVRYLKASDDRFAGINENSGWTDGNGTVTASGCTTATLRSKSCNPTDKTSWARFIWNGTLNGKPIRAIVESGYLIPGSGWVEDGLPASAADEDDEDAGCNQLAVTINHAREPGLGSLATSSDLQTAVRSVGRVKPGPGGYAPALLLLRQTGCSVLTPGNAAGTSLVRVVGAVGAGNVTQPGSIHSDSDGTGCGNNEAIFAGKAANGIRAFAAPLITSPSSPDLSKPGQITAYAAALGVAEGVLRDSGANVCGADGLPDDPCPGAPVTGRDRVFREPVDERYLTAVTGMSNAASTLTGVVTAAGWATKTLANCNPDAAAITALALTDTDRLFVNCTANNGFTGANLTINAGQVYFNGRLSSNNVTMPDATMVYVAGEISPTGLLSLPKAKTVYSGKGLGPLSNGNAFEMNTFGNTTGSPASCKTTTSPSKARLIIADGEIVQSGGGILRLCYTTVLMKSGQASACLPGAPSQAAPSASPCASSAGTGQLKQTGGDVYWTAPNTLDQTMDAAGNPLPAALTAWQDPAGPEDLAFWSESAASGAADKFQMTGGGVVQLVGVLMTPNAQPFTLSGQFGQNLKNAQYIAGSIELAGGADITMSVDPNAGITLPILAVVGLVR